MSSSAEFTQLPDGDAIVFQVLPADAPKYWLLVAVGIGVFLLSFMGFSFLLAFLVAVTCIVFGTSDLRTAEHKASARFRVGPLGVEALGEAIPVRAIEDLSIGTGSESDQSVMGRLAAAVAQLHQQAIDRVTKSLRLTSAGRTIVLAGGLDDSAASSLLAAVRTVLDAIRSAPSPARASGATLPVTAARTGVGLIAVDVWALSGEVIADVDKRLVRVGGGQLVDASYESSFMSMAAGDRVTLFWGARRGTKTHVIGRKDDRSMEHLSKGGVQWGSVSDILALANHTSGAFVKIPQPYNRVIIPNRKLYNAMGVVAVFGGVASVFGIFSGSPAAIVFLPLAIGFFVWMRKRQSVLESAIRGAAQRIEAQAGLANV